MKEFKDTSATGYIPDDPELICTDSDADAGDVTQQALEKAPRILDPIQQSIATTIQTYINHPDIDRGSAIAAIKFLNEPRLAVQIKELREIYKTFTKDGQAKQLIDKISHMLKKTGVNEKRETTLSASSRINLQREDLYLICFDFIS